MLEDLLLALGDAFIELYGKANKDPDEDKVRGCLLALALVIVIAAIDNLCKGAAGGAV